MSCHSSARTRCHKLIHPSVTVSGAIAPDFLLYSSDHFMVSCKSHHVFINQSFLLLISIHQRFLTNPVSIPHMPYGLRYIFQSQLYPIDSEWYSYQFSALLLHSFEVSVSVPTVPSVLPESDSWGLMSHIYNLSEIIFLKIFIISSNEDSHIKFLNPNISKKATM